jgi:hypothetical protein
MRRKKERNGMDSPRGRWVVAGLLCLAALTVVAVASAAPTEDKAYPSPGQTEVWPGASISYGFDQAMDKSSVEGAFSMEPATIGDFVWSSDDRSLSFRAAEPLLASTLYRVTIGTGARTAGGAAVFSRPYEWTFTTSVDNAQVGFGYQSVPVQFVTPAGKRGLPLQPGYPRLTISAALYSLDMPAFAVRYAAVQPGVPSIDLQGLPLVSSWQAHVDASDSAGRLPLPDALAPGLYVLDVQNPRVKSAQTFLLYSDFALVAKDGRESRLAWVARVPEGTVAPTAVGGL